MSVAWRDTVEWTLRRAGGIGRQVTEPCEAVGQRTSLVRLGAVSLLLAGLLQAGSSPLRAQVRHVLAPDDRCTDHAATAIAGFEDQDLEARVRSALSLGPEDDLTCGLVSGLVRLDAGLAGIGSLVGIQNLTGLTSLDLRFNLLRDLGPLAALTGLTRLTLWNNGVTDIAALAGLSNLKELDLDGNFVTDVSALSGLTNLTSLYLDGSSIRDLGPLSSLTSLTDLALSYNAITDLEPLSRLTNLTSLALRGNLITDLTALRGLVTLTYLDLRSNSITDIDALSGLANLTDLRLSGNAHLTDIRSLVANVGLGAGDQIDLTLTDVACAEAAPLAERGARVSCLPRIALRDEPVVLETLEQPQIRVVVVTKELSHPWGLAFLPDGGMLVTEREGHLRIIRDGVLDPVPVRGLPEVARSEQVAGLFDVALHPRFGQNELVYLTYSKLGEEGPTVALARGRFDGSSLRDVRDIFVARSKGRPMISRIAFGPDGKLYMTLGGTGGAARPMAQAGDAHGGKVLRLNDDGSVPSDNPFVGRPGYLPEIYSLGHRNPGGAAIHPETGALWISEHGPQGGDEVNVITAGGNYGWPAVSYGREYDGRPIPRSHAGMEEPTIIWLPSIAPTGITFYTGDRFAAWRGNLFVGAMRTGQIPGTGHIERIVLNPRGEELARESFLTDLGQRIRDVRAGPDGFLYVLTDEDEGALLRIEPAW